MKRLSSQICNLESRMRKEAADDFRKKQQAEMLMLNNVSKRVKLEVSGETLYTRESLPFNMIHLGNDNYVSIVLFINHTRVHIRKFVPDEEGFLHATKSGVSLSPAIWNSFQKKSFKFSENLLIIDKELCVSREVKEEGNLYLFQRFFQRKNLSFQFLPESIIITGSQLANMQENFSNINAKLKEFLIKKTLAYFVSVEHLKDEVTPETESITSEVLADFHDLANLTHSIIRCLTKQVSLKIGEIFNCFACEENYPKSTLHACVSLSPAEKFEDNFQMAFYKLDWRKLAKEIYHENSYEFSKLPVDDFFLSLDVSRILEDIKKMYIENENNVFDEGFSCFN